MPKKQDSTKKRKAVHFSEEDDSTEEADLNVQTTSNSTQKPVSRKELLGSIKRLDSILEKKGKLGNAFAASQLVLDDFKLDEQARSELAKDFLFKERCKSSGHSAEWTKSLDKYFAGRNSKNSSDNNGR